MGRHCRRLWPDGRIDRRAVGWDYQTDGLLVREKLGDVGSIRLSEQAGQRTHIPNQVSVDTPIVPYYASTAQLADSR